MPVLSRERGFTGYYFSPVQDDERRGLHGDLEVSTVASQ